MSFIPLMLGTAGSSLFIKINFSKVIHNHVLNFEVLGVGLSHFLSCKVLGDQQARGMSLIDHYFNNFHYCTVELGLLFKTPL